MNTFIRLLLVLILAVGQSTVSANNTSDMSLNGASFEQPLSQVTYPSTNIPTNQIIIHYHTQRSGNDSMESDPSGKRRRTRPSQAAGVEMIYLRAMSGDAYVMRLPNRLP